jgi:hypothetical protein
MNLNQKLILGLSFGCFILSIFVDNNDNSSYSSVQSVVTLNGRAQNRSSENISSVTPALEQMINRREMLRKHFPDWEGRIQSLETSPNIFDTRSSFLLKVEKNKNMRENFLKSYNRRKSEN